MVLRYGYDLTYAAIGDALGSSEEAARAAASSGVRRLRRNLERQALSSTHASARPRSPAGLVDVRYDLVDSPDRRPAASRRQPRGLCRISFATVDGGDESLARAFGVRVLRAPLDDVRRELDEYFDGRPP